MRALSPSKLSPPPLTPLFLSPSADHWGLFEQFWLELGAYAAPVTHEETGFILTPSTKENLRRIARVLVTRKYPVLLQVTSTEHILVRALCLCSQFVLFCFSCSFSYSFHIVVGGCGKD